MIAAKPRRSTDVPAGPRSSNSVAASAAPNWMDVMPPRTRPIGGTRSRPGSPWAGAVCVAGSTTGDGSALRGPLGGRDHAVAPRGLRLVQRRVRAGDQRVGGLRAVPGRDPDRARLRARDRVAELL